MRDKLLWFGSVMTLTGLFGFTAVADDLRHPNELIAISVILLSGILLVALSIQARRLHYTIPESKTLWAGAVLTLLGILGFGFVADDLQHPGEILVCAALLSAGLALLIYSWRKLRLPSPN